MQTPKQIMHQLLDYAKDCMEKRNAYPFCAFVVKNGVVISKGYNERVNLYGDRTTHGEMEALTKANKTLKQSVGTLKQGYELYSTCEPCLACFDSALWANIASFTFSVDHEDFPSYFNDHLYTIGDYQKENPNEIEVYSKVLHSEGLELFKSAKEKYKW